MTETSATSDPRLKGMAHTVITHERVNSLEEAAALRELEPSAVIKTMVIRRGENDYMFILVPGDRVIDWPKLREHLAERRLSMPDSDEARAVTGYARGTITPLGASQAWPVLADHRLGSGTVSVGGGAPGVSISIDGGELCELLGAVTADLTKPQNSGASGEN